MKLIKKKLCNALIEEAEPNAAMRFFLNKGTGAVVKVAKVVMGGLWVGGHTFLYEDAVEFNPNGMNATIHKGNVSWRLPLDKIVEVRSEFGLFTRIIRIKTLNVDFKIRCYGAKAFATEINHQIKVHKAVASS